MGSKQHPRQSYEILAVYQFKKRRGYICSTVRYADDVLCDTFQLIVGGFFDNFEFIYTPITDTIFIIVTIFIHDSNKITILCVRNERNSFGF